MAIVRNPWLSAVAQPESFTCPVCSTASLVGSAYVGDAKARVGFLMLWCEHCFTAVHVSRVLIPPTVSKVFAFDDAPDFSHLKLRDLSDFDNDVTSALRGLDFDWLAVDGMDRVGLFSTAGGGHVPSVCAAHEAEYAAAIAILLALNPTSQVGAAPEVADGLENTWGLAAARGVYGFDSDFAGTPYRLVAEPRLPARAEDLPASIRELARVVRLNTRFSESRTLDVVRLAEES